MQSLDSSLDSNRALDVLTENHDEVMSFRILLRPMQKYKLTIVNQLLVFRSARGIVICTHIYVHIMKVLQSDNSVRDRGIYYR